MIKITLDDGKIEKKIIIDESRKTYTNEEYDIIIIEIKPVEDGIEKFLGTDGKIVGNENSDFNKKYQGSQIYLIQCPEEGILSYSMGIIKRIKLFNNNLYTDKNIHTVKIFKKYYVLFPRNS